MKNRMIQLTNQFITSSLLAISALAASVVVSMPQAAHAQQAETLAETTACSLSFPSSGLCAKTTWLVGPSRSGENKMQIQFYDAQTGALSEPSASPQVVLWMPDMGHGSSPTAIARVTDAKGRTIPGLLQVNKMIFVMSGGWEVRITLGRETATLPVQVR